MPDFTPTQGRYLSFIQAYIEGFDVSPAESEIAAAIGVSPPSVNQMMKTLEQKELIRRQPGVARSIEILVNPVSIPTWTGKRITRTVTGWFPASQRKRQVQQIASDRGSTEVYCFKITLQGSNPLIWRRIETHDVSLAKFHEQIQTAMGWTNSHMHQFIVGKLRYTDPEMLDDVFAEPDEKPYNGMHLSDLIRLHGPKLRMIYEYDFGDGWEHQITLEKTSVPESGVKYPRCLAGARACPPEDIGGIYGYEDYLDAIANPQHEEHENYLEWNGPFDPNEFDPQAATKAMKRGLSSR